MGGGENEITISAVMDAVGFQKGSKELERAIRGVANTAKRLTGTIIGIGSAYQILSKAVNAYMAQNEKLSQQMNSIWTALGNVLGPIIEQIINWVTTAVSYFLEFLRLLGITSKTASQLSKSAKGAGSELKKTIAGFDELNLLNGGGGGSGGGATLKDVDPADWMKKLADLLKNKMWDEATDLIVSKMNQAIAAFKKKAAEFGDLVGDWLDDVLHMVARIINEVNWGDIGAGIAEFFNNAFRDVDGEDIGTILVAKITIALRIVLGFLETLDWGQLARILSGAVIGAINSVASAIGSADWEKIGSGIREFFENIDWDGIANAIFAGLETAWNAALDLLRGLWGKEDGEDDPPLIKSLEKLGETVKEFCEEVAPVLDDVYQNILKPFADWLVSVGLPELIDAITDSIGFAGDAIGGLHEILQGNMSVKEYLSMLKKDFEGFGESAEEAGDKASYYDDHLSPAVRGVIKAIDPFDNFKHSVDAVADAFGYAGDEVEDGTAVINDSASTMRDHVIREVDETSDSVQSSFNGISNDASGWGRDMVDSYNAGINSETPTLWGSIQNIAQTIWEWLHFSEPEKGPLADFHTWAPDMMNTFADGIKENRGKVIGAVGGLAGDISDAMNGGDFSLGQINVSGIDGVMNGFADKIVGGFENLIDRLQAIADNVVFTMPAIAEGSIVPYGVSGGATGGGSGGGNADLEALVMQLMDLISDFRDSVENMQWVARFGNVQAVVQEISRIQKQNERARG